MDKADNTGITPAQVEVAVVTTYLPGHSRPDQQQYAFAYTITITNGSDIPVQLLSRHWIITDSTGKVTEVKIAAHYACRPRNNKRGARISEHGRGKAIDISAVKLASGKELTVLRDYRKESGLPLRKSHKAACGIFGTTLGPGSDGHHKDHLHLDTASYRSGPYCK